MSSLLDSIAEVLQPKERNCLELAHSFQKLMKKEGWGQGELAQRIGIKRSTLANYLRLLSLPEYIQNSLKSGIISMGHAKALLSVEDEDRQTELHEYIVRKGLTVRRAEKWATGSQQCEKEVEDIFIAPLLAELQQKLGTKVQLEQTGPQKRICIDYYDNDDLDRLLTLLKILGD